MKYNNGLIWVNSLGTKLISQRTLLQQSVTETHATVGKGIQ